ATRGLLLPERNRRSIRRNEMSEFAPGAPQRGAFSFGGARAKPNLIDKIESEGEDGWASAGGRRGWQRLRFRQWMRGVAGLHRSFPEPINANGQHCHPKSPRRGIIAVSQSVATPSPTSGESRLRRDTKLGIGCSGNGLRRRVHALRPLLSIK